MLKKINFLLVLLLLLVSISAVSAAEDLNETISNDETVIDEEVTADVLTSSDDEVVSSNSYTVNATNYNSYFDYKTGELVSTSVKEGDTIILDGEISGVNFVFKKSINVFGNDNVELKNCMLTFSGGASGSSISKLNIFNTKDTTYGIFLNGVSKCVIHDCFIKNSGASSYTICIANNANYNNVTNNNLTAYGITYGHGTRSTTPLLISGAHYNYIANNNVYCDDANGIYLSSYSGGPLNGGNSNFNVIYNNTIQYNVLPTSWAYGIQFMGTNNTADSNTIIGAYRGISTSGAGSVIINNRILNIRGADYNTPNVENGGEYAIVASSHSIVVNNTIENTKLLSTGAAISILDNSIVENNTVQVVSATGTGIHPQGSFITIRNNNISTISGVGVHFNTYSVNLTVVNNNITSQSGICVLIQKLSSKKMPGNLTIMYNYVWTNNEYAIDARDADASSINYILYNKGKGKVADPQGEYDSSKPVYLFNGTTHIINSTTYDTYIVSNSLSAEVNDGDILYFDGEFSNKTIFINKAVKITGKNPTFYNVKFKVYTDGVWIENLTIKNNNVSNGWGVLVYRAFGATVTNCNIDVYDKNAAYAIYIIESSNVDIINNNLSSSGNYLTYTLLALYAEDCRFIDNVIITNGTSEVHTYNTEVCTAGNETCTAGDETCTGGNEVCPGGDEACTGGDEVCPGGNEVCPGGDEVCPGGNEVCPGGDETCTGGDEACTGGNEVCTSGDSVSGRYVLQGVFRTYGILMVYSSNNIVSRNNVTVTSKLNSSYNRINSTNSLVGIDLYYNSHNNNFSNNNVHVYGNDNYLYGVGVKGAVDQHDAPEGQGATNNQFIDNKILIEGTYCGEGIIVGDESENTTIIGNIVDVRCNNVSYGINLEESQISIIEDNSITLNSEMAYGIDLYNSCNNGIANNELNIISKQAFALALVNALNNEILSNFVFINATGEEIGYKSFDSFGYGVAGIYLKANSTNNNINNNNITSTKGYAITLDDVAANNNITDNYLISEEGIGDDGVNNAGNNNNVKNNYVYLVTGTFSDINVKYLDNGTFIFKTNDKGLENATVGFIDVNGKLLGNVIVKNGEAILDYAFVDYTPSSYPISADVYKKNYKYSEFLAMLYVDNGDLNITVSNVTGMIAKNAEFKAILKNMLNEGVSGILVEFYVLDEGYEVYIGKATTGEDGMAILDGVIPQIYGDNPIIIAKVNNPENFNSISGSANLTAFGLTKTNIVINTKLYPEGVLAVLKDQDGKVLANKLVSVKIDSKTYNLTTNSKGEITIPVLSKGSYMSSVSFLGDGQYNSSNASAKITVLPSIYGNKDTSVYYGNSIKYTVRIKGSDGNYVGAGKTVTIKVNGAVYKVKTDKSGYATKSLKLKAGSYTITAEFNGDKVSNKLTFKPTIIAKNIVKKKAKSVKFKAKLVNKKGKILKNKKITFKIKGKTYKISTNKKGVATLSIKNLKVGKYTITSSYGGCTVKNSIKIKK